MKTVLTVLAGAALLLSAAPGFASQCGSFGCSGQNGAMAGQQYAFNRYSYEQQRAYESGRERAHYNYSGDVIYNYERPSNSQQRNYQARERHYQRQQVQYQRQIAREYRRSQPEFPSQREATGRRVFIFDPRQAAWAAYESDGSLVKTGAASGGRGYCPDIHRACHTPTGVFSVQRKGPASCKSSKFPIGEGGAPMPYCMFFHGGYAIHGSYAVPNYNASHGCIRVHPTDAAWLSDNFIRYGTTVVVKPY